MVSKRKFKMFLGKWGGILISVVFVTIFSLIGGTYLYSSSVVDNTLAWVTQNISLYNVAIASDDESKQQVVYQITLVINNPTDNSAEITVEDLELELQDINFKVIQANNWQEVIQENGQILIQGQFVVNYDTLELLNSRGNIQMTLTGNIKAKSSKTFVTHNAERPISLITQASIHIEK